MEQELKLRLLDPAAWEQMLAHPLLALQDTPAIPMHAIYYDTPDAALQRAGLAYRVRREGEHWVATLKGEGSAAGGLHQRPEWNVEVDDARPSLAVFTESPVREILEPLRERPLLAILETEFQRIEKAVSREDGSRILLAADRGEIRANAAREPILELELELIEGDPAAVLTLGAALCRDLPLLPDAQSKMLRGLLLAGLIPEKAASRPKAIRLRRHDDAGEALAALMLAHCHQAMTELDACLAAPMAAEPFHQLRKTIRSLRSLLRFSRPLDPGKTLATLRRELALWFHRQNARRDYDALGLYWARLSDEMGMTPEPLAGFLRDRAQAAQDEAELRAVLVPLLSLWALLLRHGLAGGRSLQDFCADQFHRWDQRVHRAHQTGEDATSLHALRIQIKNLRYAALAMSPLWPGQDSKPLVKVLASLQESLGGIRDAQMALERLAPLAHGRKVLLAYEAGLLLGYLQARRGKHLKKCHKYWERWRTTARPWD
ncbi:MAG: CHAD domain-containing protein [Acidithiobacillus sp.]|uniref:CYTH and CHAD domain-containing protein n=1 Tax=Acidithiobacillus sp. TaxID=1872118 RepID=UPI003D001AAF